MSEIESLWKKHYVIGETGNFHGDMARAFSRILAEETIDRETKSKIETSISLHKEIENYAGYSGRKWFCEQF